MKYIPDLIPPDKRVLSEYFLSQKHAPSSRESKAGGNIRFAICSILLFLTIISLRHWPVSLLLVVVIFVIMPFGKNWLEQKLVFNLTFRITAVMVSGILIVAAGVDKVYRDADKVQELVDQRLAAAKAKELRDLEQYRKLRTDSINRFIVTTSARAEGGKFDDALRMIDTALTTALNTNESLMLTKAKVQLNRRGGLYYVSKHQYRKAIPFLNAAINVEADQVLLYNRGLCYSKVGLMQDAVNDLRQAMNAGHSESGVLYEKINPLRRRVAYYVTRCCDGSTSSATGRGACSHHGGVCNWNDPVYETYRKY